MMAHDSNEIEFGMKQPPKTPDFHGADRCSLNRQLEQLEAAYSLEIQKHRAIIAALKAESDSCAVTDFQLRRAA
ncbi:MAG: hypothetical protein R3C49_09010 [Planctomycetaceae bacterium]